MNKTQLIDKVAEKIGSSKTDARAAVDAILDSITEALEEGEQMQIVGFGTFKTSKRQARKGRNPQTGAEIQIPATTVATFTVGKELKDAVKSSSEDAGKGAVMRSASAAPAVKGKKPAEKKRVRVRNKRVPIKVMINKGRDD
ncbi:HU DNA-binding transcriptional regulator alpha subunit [Candidatus Regiella insecticola LSR1]|uniref:DNA-binding protein HU-beta n=1 Tax=Candidatus Regiella insecticola LSR1 TaxID=663321 RepID=E0WUT4_9ENTR|nr:HU DNA-binding transcriptional regulator alpha subunit [Candidatus Regiella insecticola LSR1]